MDGKVIVFNSLWIFNLFQKAFFYGSPKVPLTSWNFGQTQNFWTAYYVHIVYLEKSFLFGSNNLEADIQIHINIIQCRWASLLCITPPKRYCHLPFFNLPGLQKPGRNHFPKHSYWGITDLGILVSQNNLWTNSLNRVQGDCPYILFSSFSKLF